MDYHLRHPLTNTPATAAAVGYHTQAGRAVGLVLQFPDGHRCHLTYNEIGNLQEVTHEEKLDSTIRDDYANPLVSTPAGDTAAGRPSDAEGDARREPAVEGLL